MENFVLRVSLVSVFAPSSREISSWGGKLILKMHLIKWASQSDSEGLEGGRVGGSMRNVSSRTPPRGKSSFGTFNWMVILSARRASRACFRAMRRKAGDQLVRGRFCDLGRWVEIWYWNRVSSALVGHQFPEHWDCNFTQPPSVTSPSTSCSSLERLLWPRRNINFQPNWVSHKLWSSKTERGKDTQIRLCNLIEASCRTLDKKTYSFWAIGDREIFGTFRRLH